MSPGVPDDSSGSLIEGILQRGEPIAAPPGEVSELWTFLFADIRGYTRFTQQRGDAAAEKLTAKFAVLVRELVVQFGGTVVDLRGDEALCVFGSPRRCLRLAVALQQRCVEETLAEVSLPMTIGVGIDAGEVVRGPDGYRGGALNLAARLCARAKAGEVLASAEVTHLARTVDGVRYVVLDAVQLKGLSEPVRPVRVLPDGEDPAHQIAALLTAATASTTPGRRVRWLPGALARRPRLALAAAAGVAVLVAGGVVAAVQRDSASRSAVTGENSVGVLDAATGRITGQVAVDAKPVAAATEGHSVWTVNADANTVSRVDTVSHQVHTVSVQSAPIAIAIGLRAVWVANGGSGTLSRIDPTNYQPQTIQVGAAPSGVAVVGGSIWVTDAGDGTVARIDPNLNKVVEWIPVGDGPTGIAAGADAIWVANSADNTVSKINLRGTRHTVIQDIPVGQNPTGIAVAGGSVWVTNNLAGNVARIATTGESVAETVQVGALPTQIATAGGRIWVASQGSETIAEIDPVSARVTRTVRLGAIPGGLAAAGGRLWVTTTIDPKLHRGGTMRILGEDIRSVDPSFIRSQSQLWLLPGSYDGLVGFRRSTGAEGTVIVPDLATAVPKPTHGGRNYTFQLRSGIRWSNGTRLTVFDVRRGLQRTIASVHGIPTPFDQIVGASACRTTVCNPRGIAVDRAAGTVTITLVRSASNFLGALAFFSFAVPAATPLAENRTRRVPATGPYQISRYVPGKIVVLTRNRFYRQWSAAAQPDGFPARIEWQIGPADERKLAKLQLDGVAAGRFDWADARGSATAGALQTRFGSRLHVTPTLTVHALSLNTRVPPFDDIRVRQALAYAIDRDAIKNDWPEPGAITCQMMQPNIRAYKPYCPYTLHPDASGVWHSPDEVKAHSLVKQSGTAGMSVTVICAPTDAKAFQHIVDALTDLGYDAHLSIDRSKDSFHEFAYVADSRNKAQAGFYGWVAGDASPASSLNTFACSAFRRAKPDNQNTAEFCDRSFDRKIAEAEATQVTSPETANAVWTAADRLLADAVPWIPLVTPTWVDVVSARVHDYQRSPLAGPLYDQMWVR